MTKEYSVNPFHLLACTPHVDDFHENKALRHVYIGDGYICASNGHTMLMIEDEAVKGCNHLIPIVALRELDLVLDSGIELGFKMIAFTENCGAFRIPGCKDIKFEFSKLKPVNYKKVDVAKPTVFVNERPIFNPRLLMAFQKSYEYLTGDSDLGICLYTQGLKDSAYVEMFDDVHGVIKPMYSTDLPAFNPEVLQ